MQIWTLLDDKGLDLQGISARRVDVRGHSRVCIRAHGCKRSRKEDSNPWPTHYECVALPTRYAIELDRECYGFFATTFPPSDT